jgi:hypothetical protein
MHLQKFQFYHVDRARVIYIYAHMNSRAILPADYVDGDNET